MHITTKVVSFNPDHGEGYSIQFANDSLQTCGCKRVLPVFSTRKTDYHDITEILLKVALNTIYLTPPIHNNLTICTILYAC